MFYEVLDKFEFDVDFLNKFMFYEVLEKFKFDVDFLNKLKIIQWYLALV